MSYVNSWNKKSWKLSKFVWVLLILFFSCAEKQSKPKPEFDSSCLLSKEMETLSIGIESNFDDSIVDSWNRFSLCIDSLVSEIKPKIANFSDPVDIVNAVKTVVFHDLNIRFEKDIVISNYLPQLVYTSGSGSCVGIGLIIMLLGERLGLPFYGVLVPTHFFVRYDNGNCRINIEPIKSGETLDDTWYLSQYDIDKQGIRNNLTVSQTAAVMHYSVGNIFLKSAKADLAVRQYREALRLWPSLTEAIGNLSVALDMSGNYAEALDVLESIKDDCQKSTASCKNMGSLLLKNGLYKRAVKEYAALLERTPDDPEILCDLGVSYFYLKKYQDAKKYLGKALEIKPDLERANQLILLCK